MTEISLNNLKIASVGYVSHIGGNFAIKNHLQNAGFRLGSKIVVLNITPYTSSYMLDVNGKVKTFRKMAVSLIRVTV
ncbi:MAG: hypothetical protein PHC46_01425 [Clostridia bacterium]|nr:hypothetical protein [Clostridia bacterium]